MLYMSSSFWMWSEENPRVDSRDGFPVDAWDGFVIPCCALRMNVLSLSARMGWDVMSGWVRMNSSSSRVREGLNLIAVMIPLLSSAVPWF